MTDSILLRFQSTSPTGEDTRHPPLQGGGYRYFNPLPPQGKTLDIPPGEYSNVVFQSTSPTGEDTRTPNRKHHQDHISIHFPHRGRHHAPLSLPLRQRISIHFPHRGRHSNVGMICFNVIKFQSTSPTGEDTVTSPNSIYFSYISIHFPHRGRHNPSCSQSRRPEKFQSTSPTGEDTTPY